MEERLLLIMANARKIGGRCIAGLEVLGLGEQLAFGEWVRPVSDREHGVFELFETRCAESGRDVGMLDVVRLPLGAQAPERNQPENRRAHPGPWHLVEQLDLSDAAARNALFAKCRQGANVLGGTGGSVPVAGRAPRSLEVRHCVAVEWECTNGGKARAHFPASDNWYDLPVTDPIWEALVLRAGPGRHRTEQLAKGCTEAFLTMSLGEPWQPPGHLAPSHWKLVAGVAPH